jgi:tetratricopeptide (TPR) repeat protein
MIIEQHYDEEVLIALLDEQKEGAARDPHIAACGTCTSVLDSIRQVTSALQDDVVWDRQELSEQPKPETRHALLSFASATASEDAAAEPRVKAMVAKSHEEWRPLLDAHPEWRTAGFVRRLIAAVDAINFTSPTDAVELTKITVDVAESLPGDSERLRKLRAGAWREYAWALYYVGSHLPAMSAITRCLEVLGNSVVDDFDRARAQLVKARICVNLEDFSEALALTRSARVTFASFGDTRRYLIAETTEGGLLMNAGRHSDALRVHLKVAAYPGADDDTRANALHNAAICSREIGDFDQAKKFFAKALGEYERLNLSTFRAKARWSFASILVAEGQFDSAINLLTTVREEVEQLGMAHSVALVCVDTAEAMLLADRPEGVADLCRSAIDYFREAQLTYSQGALTALSHLREVADSKRLTITDLRGVRSFIEILPTQPKLLFASLA